MSNPNDFVIENDQAKGLVILRDYKGKDEEVRIPHDVTAIGTGAFSGIRRSIRVIIPDSVTRIGGFAFTGCSGLISVVIPGTVKTIPAKAFSDCSRLEDVTICEGVTELGEGVFADCTSLKKLTIPGSIATVGRANASSYYEGPFHGCKNLEEVILSEGVTGLENKAFEGCANLKRLTIPDSVTTIDKDFLDKGSKVKIAVSAPSKLPAVWRPNAAVCFAEDGGQKSDPRYKTHCKYIKSNDEKLVTAAMGHPALLELMCREKLITAKSINLYAVAAKKTGNTDRISIIDRYIKENLDGECSSTDFVIKNGILTEYLGPGGDVVIPEGVTEIGKEVFAKSKTLTGVTLPQSLKTVGTEAFASCNGLKSVTVPRGVTEIGLSAFDWCKNLRDVYIDDLAAWCRIIFGGIYANCGNPLSAGARLHVNGKVLTELVIPEGIENVENYTFFRCAGLESVVIPERVKSIGEYAFFECTDLKSISLPDGLTSIGDGAFLRCKKLTEVKIPKTVTSIGNRAFMDCCKLADVILPEGVELLGDQAFGDCGQLKVSLPGSLKRPKADMFGRLWEKAPFAGSGCSIQIEKWSALITKMVDGCTIGEINTANYSLIPGEILLPVAASMMKKKDWDPSSETAKALLKGLEKSAGKLRAAALTNAEWLQLLCDNRRIKAEDLDAWLEEAEKQDNAEAKAVLLNYQNSLGSAAVEKAREKKEKVKENYADSLVERAAKRDPSKGIEGMTFVITGQLKAWPKVWSSRKAVEEYLAKYGAKLGASLTIETDYLVTNDTDSGSKKNEKAKSLGVEVINEEEFNQMIGRRFMDAETIRVPSWVKTIEPAAFSIPEWEAWRNGICFKNLKEVILPEQITAIGEKAFAGAGKLEKINMPDAVTSIGRWAFAGCEKLTEIELPKSLVNIGARAFDGCKMLKTVSVPEGVKSIGIGAFGSCSSLEEIRIPGSVVNIESDAFDIAGFKDSGNLTIVAPKGSCAEDFARNNGIAFAAEGDMSDLKDSPKDAPAETIEQEPPEASDPADFAIKNGFLGKYVGIGGRVVIPDGVTAVGYMAFENCANLTEVVIPEGVKSIGWNAFQGCVGLKRVKLPDTLKQIEINAFKNCGSLAEIRIPAGVTEICGGAFEDCGGLTNLTIPESVTNIADRAFTGCRGLKDAEGFVIIRNVLYSYLGHGGDVAVPKGVTRIGGNAFHQCAGVTSVTLPEGVTDIGAFAFDNCTDLQRVVLPEGVTNIGIYAFCNCSALKEIVIPGSVTSIGKKAFSDCVSLESITIPGSVPVIEEEMFYNCSKLTEVRLSEGVEGLGKSVFLFCDGLKEIWLPASFKKMGRDNSFARCTIHAPAKSFAEKYAKKNKIAFAVWEKE